MASSHSDDLDGSREPEPEELPRVEAGAGRPATRRSRRRKKQATRNQGGENTERVAKQDSTRSSAQPKGHAIDGSESKSRNGARSQHAGGRSQSSRLTVGSDRNVGPKHKPSGRGTELAREISPVAAVGLAASQSTDDPQNGVGLAWRIFKNWSLSTTLNVVIILVVITLCIVMVFAFCDGKKIEEGVVAAVNFAERRPGVVAGGGLTTFLLAVAAALLRYLKQRNR